MCVIGESRVISNNGTALAVKLYPKTNTDTVVLLHGGPGVPDEMTEVREWFSQYMQVITFDQRGLTPNGKTCSYSIPEYISDINCIAGEFGIRAFHLFGHSWGGLYAQLYAEKYPEKILSLFLCSPASGTGKIWNITEKEIFRFNYHQSSFTEWLFMGLNTAMGFMGNKSAYRRLFRQIIINYHKGYNVELPDKDKLARINARAGTMTRKAIKGYEFNAVFNKTAYPVIITFGEFDAYGQSIEFTFKRFPGAERAIIPMSGHTPWKHNMSAFSEVLDKFYHKP